MAWAFDRVGPQFASSGFGFINNLGAVNLRRSASRVRPSRPARSCLSRFTLTARVAVIASAVIVRTRKELRRKDGTYIRFDRNAAVLINNEGEPVGTRVFGPVSRELH